MNSDPGFLVISPGQPRGIKTPRYPAVLGIPRGIDKFVYKMRHIRVTRGILNIIPEISSWH
jgi:hypothetical protein